MAVDTLFTDPEVGLVGTACVELVVVGWNFISVSLACQQRVLWRWGWFRMAVGVWAWVFMTVVWSAASWAWWTWWQAVFIVTVGVTSFSADVVDTWSTAGIVGVGNLPFNTIADEFNLLNVDWGWSWGWWRTSLNNGDDLTARAGLQSWSVGLASATFFAV